MLPIQQSKWNYFRLIWTYLLALFMRQSLYMKGFSCIPDSEKPSLKRKLLTAVQKGMFISMARNTSVLMFIEQPICAYFYY